MTMGIRNLPEWNPMPELLPLILLTPVTQGTLSSPGSDNHQKQTFFKDSGDQFPLGLLPYAGGAPKHGRVRMQSAAGHRFCPIPFSAHPAIAQALSHPPRATDLLKYNQRASFSSSTSQFSLMRLY